jgi:transketolase
MRTLPNMLIAAPSDPMETRACMRYLVDKPRPSYLRLGKAGEPNFHAAPPDVEPGRWLKVRAGNTKRALLSTGAGLQIAMDWATNQKFEEYAVYSVTLWSMADKVAQVAGCIVRPVALNQEVCGTVGSQETRNRLGGLLPCDQSLMSSLKPPCTCPDHFNYRSRASTRKYSSLYYSEARRSSLATSRC